MLHSFHIVANLTAVAFDWRLCVGFPDSFFFFFGMMAMESFK